MQRNATITIAACLVMIPMAQGAGKPDADKNNPQVKTPNLDRFASQAVVMNKAYCPSSVCCPSRSALLTGKHATHTGVYGNKQNLKHAPKAKDLVTLPEYFGQHGYHTLSAGKIFHKHGTKDGIDEGQWAFQEHVHLGGGNKGLAWKEKPEAPDLPIKGYDEFMWGACNAKTEETKDYLACKWAAEQLERDFDDKPFFLALGISKPHLPWYVPQEFFEMYPLEKITPAPVKPGDLDDILDRNGKPFFKPSIRWKLAERHQMHDDANRAYLATVSYVDTCLGVLFDALEKSPRHKDTIVMLWGDHGWHLGEKFHYGKTWLWEEAARVPFIVRAPGVSPEGVKCEGVVNLIDMYPTLLELCELPPNPENDGRSFAKLLAEPSREWTHPTLTTYNFRNHSITDGRYRYTWYGGRAGGAEELYDHQSDPLEHTNLASSPEHQEVRERLKRHLPAHNEPPGPENPDNDLKKSRTKKAPRKDGNEQR